MHKRGTAVPKPGSVQSSNVAQPIRPVVSHSPSGNGKPIEEEVRIRAYLMWEASGRPGGDGVNFWLQAEREFHQV